MSKLAFFEIENWEKEYIKNKESGIRNQELSFYDKKLDKDNLPTEKDAEIISVFVGSKVDKEVIDSFPNLKLITTRSTGFDHIDLKTTKEKNIKTAYVPGYGDNTVAEMAFGLILTLSRKIYEAYDRIRETGSFSLEGLRGFDLKDKTIGIVGTGRIGKYMIKIAKGFSMKIIAFDAYPNEKLSKEMNFQYVELNELLGKSDIISLHVPYIPSTRASNEPQPNSSGQTTHHLINSENINKIKKGAILINTSRGAIVETAALVKGLEEEILGGAGLDVLEEEGTTQDEKSFLLYGHPKEHDLKTILANHVLIDMPNVIITPHNAFNTQEALQRILNTDIENIKSFLEKGETTHPIGNST
ncbi:MAG TPA: hydroxyacid dehydrogenase [Candidatus Wolfebacteria bacterium]|nr:hydroxyacid dehydrogenase [Candidatus Wolfebacteria bacterium]